MDGDGFDNKVDRDDDDGTGNSCDVDIGGIEDDCTVLVAAMIGMVRFLLHSFSLEQHFMWCSLLDWLQWVLCNLDKQP